MLSHDSILKICPNAILLRRLFASNNMNYDKEGKGAEERTEEEEEDVASPSPSVCCRHCRDIGDKIARDMKQTAQSKLMD